MQGSYPLPTGYGRTSYIKACYSQPLPLIPCSNSISETRIQSILSEENIKNWMITSTNQGVLQMVYQPNILAEISPAVSPPFICWTWRLPLLMPSGLSALLVNKHCTNSNVSLSFQPYEESSC
jgi:hypothetical protein